ncbi:hypothetical protein DPMN_026848 [Dreissena polymorpha]|uniref:G-protein coupled receptors family 1 profile domain-containing protein n=1 Tax=Dreissena polymorpha TaxID=45954 RepID=A0A9D4LTC5_DREPO|nr:hypothetical protein DPMN_026848 [Dreissena polymorpha]
MVPWAIYYTTFPYKTKFQILTLCNELWPNGDEERRSYFLGAIFLCCYTVPLVLIVTCYFLIAVHVWRRRAPGEKTTSSAGVVHRSKVKAVKMLCTVVVLFAFSWLPLYIIRLSNLYGWSANKEVTEFINPIAQWLGSSNSGMNPIIYVFFSKRYRHGFRNTLATCCCWRWRMNRLQNQSLSNSMAAQPYMFRNSNARQSYVHGRGNSEKSLSNNSQKRTSYV